MKTYCIVIHANNDFWFEVEGDFVQWNEQGLTIYRYISDDKKDYEIIAMFKDWVRWAVKDTVSRYQEDDNED
jgi:hypothetical protein